MTMEKQHLSALIDGELHFSEGRRAVAYLLDNPESGELISRYQMLGAGMRGEHPLVDLGGLFERIHQSIQNEPTVLAPAAVSSAKKGGLFGRIAAGGAIAASVAMLIVVGVTRMEAPVPGAQQVAATVVEASQPLLISDESEIAVVELGEANPADINRYLVDHGDYVASGSLMPLATMVSYDGF